MGTHPWANDALFYHIYPLGLCGAPQTQTDDAPVCRIAQLTEWIPHLQALHCNAVYFGPLWESRTHGYDTTDYTRLDRRLGSNADFAALCQALHAAGIRVVVDGVFNHVGRDFFAFQDILANGEQSRYRDWFCNLRFGGTHAFGDPFCYDSWHGCAELVKLNLRNAEVVDYLCNAVAGWMEQFAIDGIRFDAADCLDMDFIRHICAFVRARNPECWLMGELIHGNYAQWANAEAFDSTTNYECWKGLWSSHNDKNYFEINYALNRQSGKGGIYPNLWLYNFADNHDVSRLASKLAEPRHLPLVYALLYAMPGIPSIYYGSEFALQADKRPENDWNLRPALSLQEQQARQVPLCAFLERLGACYAAYPALRTGAFETIVVRNQQLVIRRGADATAVYCLLNLEDADATLPLPIAGDGWQDVLTETPIAATGQLVLPPMTARWVANPVANGKAVNA